MSGQQLLFSFLSDTSQLNLIQTLMKSGLGDQ
jgi:hypothetical protein